jgi:hypothetical protein
MSDIRVSNILPARTRSGMCKAVSQAKAGLYILNMTQGNYFVYTRNDKGYLKIVKELTTANAPSRLSHWATDDRIVFVPSHINSYVDKNYGRLNI